MNTYRTHILISSASFFVALLFFAIYNQLIMFRSPFSIKYTADDSAIMQKKQTTLHYFHGDKWKIEKQELLWTDSAEKNIFQLINAWLALLDEEHIMIKKTTLQSVLISNAGCAYLSFDHNILDKEETIFKKWMVIEGLLKTIAVHNIPIQQVQFLVQHQPLHDAHLDFSLPWSIHGFMN